MKYMTQIQFNSLPKFAQNEIAGLLDRIAELESMAHAGRLGKEAPIVVDPYRDSIGFKRHTTVRFAYEPTHPPIDVSISDDGSSSFGPSLRIATDGTMYVIPQAQNTVRILTDRR